MTGRRIPTVLTIAGSDSGGGAGIQGDLKTLQAMGVYGLSVLTSITAQNTRGVAGAYDLPTDCVALQLKTVAQDIPIDAVKTGMLSNESIVDAVASLVPSLGLRHLVADPVMRAKSGDALISSRAGQVLLERLVPLAEIVTPNIPEAEELSRKSIRNVADMKEAARVIAGAGTAVLVKGGHLEGESKAVDILYDGRSFYEFGAERIDVPGGVHGTGCAYASAIAAGLAKGFGLVDAVGQAKAYITGAIRARLTVGRGHPVLDHAWEWSKRG